MAPFVGEMIPSLFTVGGLIERGIIKDREDLRDVMGMAKRFLLHHCTTGRCLIPVRNENGKKDVIYRCKAPNNQSINLFYPYQVLC